MCRTRMQIDLIDALRRVLAVHELQITPLVEPFDQLHRFDYGLRDALDPQFDWKLMGRTLLESTPERALLLMEGTFGSLVFHFPYAGRAGQAYIIGPCAALPPGSSCKKIWSGSGCAPRSRCGILWRTSTAASI